MKYLERNGKGKTGSGNYIQKQKKNKHIHQINWLV